MKKATAGERIADSRGNLEWPSGRQYFARRIDAAIDRAVKTERKRCEWWCQRYIISCSGANGPIPDAQRWAAAIIQSNISGGEPLPRGAMSDGSVIERAKKRRAK